MSRSSVPVTELARATLETAIGPVVLTAATTGLVSVQIHPPGHPAPPAVPGPDAAQALLWQGLAELEQYFAGRRRVFDVPLQLRAAPPFTTRILSCLRQVPYGATLTYGALAALAGHPAAARAVGQVMASNPWPIIVPCHRVVGSGARLIGYSGGSGLPTKVWLLEFERKVLAAARILPFRAS